MMQLFPQSPDSILTACGQQCLQWGLMKPAGRAPDALPREGGKKRILPPKLMEGQNFQVRTSSPSILPTNVGITGRNIGG